MITALLQSPIALETTPNDFGLPLWQLIDSAPELPGKLFLLYLVDNILILITLSRENVLERQIIVFASDNLRRAPDPQR